MPTIPLLKTAAPVAITGKILPARKRGRPSRPWLRPHVRVSHPVNPHQERSIPPATVALWCGVSRQTADRWAADPQAMPTASLRLCQLYAHGLPPIPPERWQEPQAARWLSFGFYFEPGRRQWCLAVDGQPGANAEQVSSLYASLQEFDRLYQQLVRVRARLQGAEAEAARLQEIVANQV